MIPSTPPIPSKPVPVKKEKAPKAPAEPRPRNEFYDKLTEITASDPKLSGGKIGAIAAKLQKAGYTVNDLKRFALWWWSDKYRKTKGEFPSLETVHAKIAMVVKHMKAGTDATPAVPDEMSPAQIQRMVDASFAAAYGQSVPAV